MGADAVDDRLSLYDRILGLKPYWSKKHVSIAAERGSLASEGFSNATGIYHSHTTSDGSTIQ